MPWWQDGPAAAPRSVRLPALADALRIWKNEVNIPGRMMKHELIITCHEPSLIYYYILIYYDIFVYVYCNYCIHMEHIDDSNAYFNRSRE